VIAKLHEVVSASLAKPEVKQKLGALGLEPAPLAPAQFGVFIQQEIAKWSREIRDAGIEPQ
jgi:tripartite-type tricarboxylate transporter receptor subunit TctC